MKKVMRTMLVFLLSLCVAMPAYAKTEDIPIESFDLIIPDLLIGVGGTLPLGYSITPENATLPELVFESENPAVATVKDWVITGKGKGRTTIHASSKDGSIKSSVKISVGLFSPLKFKATSAGYNSIRLTWKKTSGANGYEIYRKATNGKYTKIKTIKNGDTKQYIPKKLSTGKKYAYKIRAYQMVSGKKQTSAMTSPAQTAKPVPIKPSVSIKKTSNNKARVTWKKVSGANGYQIKMSTNKQSGYKTVYTSRKGSKTNFTKGSLSKGKTYYLKVRAYRNVGGKKVYGSYSTVQKIKI